MAIHTEYTFETEIVNHLSQNGYRVGKANDFDKELAMDRALVLEFLKTQTKAWKAISKVYGNEVESRVLKTLYKEQDLNGTLHVLRKGFTDMGVKFLMTYEKSEHSLNETVLANYQKNIFSITRQVKYHPKNEKSIDLVLFLNGLPVATAELKNQFTGQTYKDAIQQYNETREANFSLFAFKKGALVHFALDTDYVYLTTKIAGKESYFLPFNKGNKGGAGNPLNPEGHRTDYLWKEIWQKDRWFEIIKRFITLEKKTYLDKASAKRTDKENLIFPRYHQLDAVRQLLQMVRQEGSGQNYLIQHSAGSGKSNTIAWLAYRLSALHNPQNEKIFDSVIVITDRKVLDTQLQNIIFSIEHIDGVVQKIDKNSQQLAKSLKAGKHIIITTLQKFPFILNQAKDLPNRNYAVIIDEAHSSQSGDAHIKMKEALKGNESNIVEDMPKGYGKTGTEEDENDVDGLEFATDYEIKQKNLSFFAFTATPKAKTLSIFGTKGEDDKPYATHLYPMRQAIEEGFILDVLKNYTTYEVYWKLIKKVHDDPEMHKKKARKALGKYIALNEHNIAQKTDVILDHFEKIARHKIGGKAKAMVITGSRLQAVRYFEEFKRQIKEKKLNHIKALVAFSGEITDPKNNLSKATEANLNGFSEKELPKKFENEYNILLVAEKYQTGFDQPLLQTMYVDKKISGVKAVQTLSRLNRTCVGKNETFVLDFVNDYETIKQSFQPYYEATTLTENPDPNLLYHLKNRIYESRVVWQTEVEAFANVYFKHSGKITDRVHAQLNRFIDPASERFQAIVEEDEKDDLQNVFSSYISMFTFLSQLMPYQDTSLDMLYPYISFLLKKIAKTNTKTTYSLDDKVALEYYRLQKVAEGDIILELQGEDQLTPPTEAGLRNTQEEKDLLSKIIDLLNEQYHTDFTEADALTFEQFEMDLQERDDLRQQAQSNTFDNFKYGFDEVFLEIILRRMDLNQDIFDRIMENESGFGDKVREYIAKKVYQGFKKEV
jgi:type I restriction enzyme R subunit